jgi:hypothetical protein
VKCVTSFQFVPAPTPDFTVPLNVSVKVACELSALELKPSHSVNRPVLVPPASITALNAANLSE